MPNAFQTNAFQAGAFQSVALIAATRPGGRWLLESLAHIFREKVVIVYLLIPCIAQSKDRLISIAPSSTVRNRIQASLNPIARVHNLEPLCIYPRWVITANILEILRAMAFTLLVGPPHITMFERDFLPGHRRIYLALADELLLFQSPPPRGGGGTHDH